MSVFMMSEEGFHTFFDASPEIRQPMQDAG